MFKSEADFKTDIKNLGIPSSKPGPKTAHFYNMSVQMSSEQNVLQQKTSK